MKRILWLEDEVVSFESFNISFLENNDKYQIIRALDLEDARNKFNSENFDLIIIDMIVPSGIEGATMEQLRNAQSKYFGFEFLKEIYIKIKTIPVIILTVVSSASVFEKIRSIPHKNITVLWKYDSSFENLFEVVQEKLKN